MKVSTDSVLALRSCLAKVSDILWNSPVGYSGASWFMDLQTIFTVSVSMGSLTVCHPNCFMMGGADIL